MNGGFCYDQIGNFSCECLLGFTGRRCEQSKLCLFQKKNVTICRQYLSMSYIVRIPNLHVLTFNGIFLNGFMPCLKTPSEGKCQV